MLKSKKYLEIMSNIQTKYGSNIRDICEERLGTLWARDKKIYHETIDALNISAEDIDLVLGVILACEKIRI